MHFKVSPIELTLTLCKSHALPEQAYLFTKIKEHRPDNGEQKQLLSRGGRGEQPNQNRVLRV
jgi:hypothetical protein